MKTLKKAFEEWADDAQFKVLASKSRTITERIFLKKYGSRDINEFDATLVKKILSESKEGKDVKIKATAALVHTLEFCAEKGECKQPAYTYSIVTDVTDVKSDDSQAVAKKPTPEAKPVIQLDADTLKPVKQWPSANSVKTELGISNVQRGIQNRSICGGFYWCYPGDEKDFKPAVRKQTGRPSVKKETPKKKAPKASRTSSKEKGEDAADPAPAVQRTSPAARKVTLDDFTDEQLYDELKARGWHGDIEKVVRVTL